MKTSTPYSLIARVAKLYDFCLWLIGYESSVNNFVSQLPFDIHSSLRVLDAGCGTGLYSLSILKRYPSSYIVAFDYDKKLVERFRYKLETRGLNSRVNLFSADIAGPLKEIDNQKFDLIITAGVLEYVPIEETVVNLSRFLLPGGYFVNSPVKDNLLGWIIARLYSCKPYSRERNLMAFESNGFTLKKLLNTWSFKELHIFQK